MLFNFFYLPYLSSIHEKTNCIAMFWTVFLGGLDGRYDRMLNRVKSTCMRISPVMKFNFIFSNNTNFTIFMLAIANESIAKYCNFQEYKVLISLTKYCVYISCFRRWIAQLACIILSIIRRGHLAVENFNCLEFVSLFA